MQSSTIAPSIVDCTRGLACCALKNMAEPAFCANVLLIVGYDGDCDSMIV